MEYNKCRCGNLKTTTARRCRECYIKGRRRPLSRLVSERKRKRINKHYFVEDDIIARNSLKNKNMQKWNKKQKTK